MHRTTKISVGCVLTHQDRTVRQDAPYAKFNRCFVRRVKEFCSGWLRQELLGSNNLPHEWKDFCQSVCQRGRQDSSSGLFVTSTAELFGHGCHVSV